MSKIRARYAPSPTGFFHIGGARTALFNYLFAKHFNGTFIVRIEDTDTARNVEGGIESQLANLKWMGIFPDESILNPGNFGPYKQTDKLKRYQELANELVKRGLAYYCFCNEEELEKNRQIALANHLPPKYNRKCLHLTHEEIETNLKKNIPYVIRLKMKDNVNIEWDDLIRGHMSVPTSALTDCVILKSNGIPMYNFAVVVDDYDMQITHVLRGEEHISNTPYQIAIKETLGFDKQPISYGHLSIITDETGKKLSKRNKELKQFIEDYRNLGVLPSALVNFLALLGWSPKSNQEIMSLDELVNQFDLANVSKAPACFDFKKLLWISSQHIKNMNEQDYLNFVRNYLTINLNDFVDRKFHDLILLTFKNQINYASEINQLIKETFSGSFDQLDENTKNYLTSETSLKILTSLENELILVGELNLDNVAVIVNKIKTQTNVKGKDLFMPLRLISSYQQHGPEINKILVLFGKDKILKNIRSIKGEKIWS